MAAGGFREVYIGPGQGTDPVAQPILRKTGRYLRDLKYLKSGGA